MTALGTHRQPQVTEFVPTPDNARQLRDAFGCFATGVTIVTTASPAGPIAIAANSFSSVSLEPPLVLWSLGRASRRAPYFTKAAHFAVHVLQADQDALCWRVASDMHGLEASDYTTSAHGVPLLNTCLARFECTAHSVLEGGDHDVIMGQVHKTLMKHSENGLGFFRGKMGKFITTDA